MNKQFIILVDVDGVLEDLHVYWVDALNKKYGTNVNPEDIRSWSIETYFPTLSRTQVFSPLHEEIFWKNMKPRDDAIEVLRKLKSSGKYKLYIASSSHPDTVKFKCGFIRRYFGDIFSHNDIIIIHDKQLLNADILIDDAPHNLIGGNYNGVLFSAPHNICFDADKNGLIRVDNWYDVYNVIGRIADERKDT